MGQWGNVDFEQLRKLQKQLNQFEFDRQAFCEGVAKELAARFLRGVTKRTPVGQYPASSGKMGGTLRRGWTAGSSRQASYNALFQSSEGADTKAYLDSIQVQKNGDVYTIEIINPVEYASYVEYGHRTRGGKGWVPGKYMMTITENEINSIAPSLLQKRLEQKLREVMQ